MKHGAIVTATPTIILGAKRHYIGAAPYTYPLVKGDTWSEYDTSDNYIQDWVYNGSLWLSKNEHKFEQWIESNTAATVQKTIALSPNSSGINQNIFLTTINQFLTCNITPTTVADTWTWQIRANSNSGFTTLAIYNNLGQAANVPNLYSNLLNIQLNYDPVNRHSIALRESRNAGSITKRGHFWVNYRIIRG